MKSRTFGTLALMAVLTPAAAAWSPLRAPLSIQPESKLWVEGTSTVRAYECRATRIDGSVVTEPATAGTAIADLQKGVKRVEIAIPVSALECGNATMNDHLRKALRAAESPVIRYRLASHQVTARGESTGAVQMSGQLSIAGKENPASIAATLERLPGGALRVKGSEPLKMTDFGVQPPKLMMGTLKVHDPVTVHFDVVLKP